MRGAVLRQADRLSGCSLWPRQRTHAVSAICHTTGPLSFVGLALLAGGPAVIGIWTGRLAYSLQWTAIALTVGAGAIAQVVVEVCGLIGRSNRQGIKAVLTPPPSLVWHPVLPLCKPLEYSSKSEARAALQAS